ncbi:MAG: cytochrome b562 [Verrucomicrobiota bacterium]
MIRPLANAMTAAALILCCAHSTTFAEGDGSPLHDKMEQMGKALHAVTKQLGDSSKKETTLALIAKLRTNAAAARELTPTKVKTIPEKNRAEFMADYKAAMDDLISQIDRLAIAVKENKPEAQQAALKEIGETKQDSHVTYRSKQKEHSTESSPGEKRNGEHSSKEREDD